jgi:hypothetical protein
VAIQDLCVGCNQTDDHPKHHHGLPNGVLESRHFDCCNCDACKVVLKSAKDKRGQELRDHVIENADAIVKKAK